MTEAAYSQDRHRATDQPTIRLVVSGERPEAMTTIAQIAPEAGCNLLSLQVNGIDHIYARRADSVLPNLGAPILYPMPNRVRGGTFGFAGRTYQFEPNMEQHFIHGLVQNQPWDVDEPQVIDEGVALHAEISFSPDKDIYAQFPIRNTLELVYTIKPGVVRYDWTVRNDDNLQQLPFGLAIHPYFPLIGPREAIRIQVPAQKWMEAEDLMPTGRLVDIEDGPADLRVPIKLSDLDIDDVFWGMEEEHPATIYYDDIGKKLTLHAADFFTHCVVYTPEDQPYFCIENQSCSTDAHNLHVRGFEKAAHLTILDPGTSLTAWIEFRISDQ